MEPDLLEPSIDFALLADAVQAANGKLFILGGGWDSLWVSQFPARHPTLGIGVRVRVPWTWADRQVTLSVELQDEDGGSIIARGPLTHTFMVSRPRGLPEGTDIGLVRAFAVNNLLFEKAGGYSFVISVNDVVRDRLRFTVRLRT